MARLPHFGPATPVLRYFNWIVAALVTLFAAYLHVLFFLNAGGLTKRSERLGVNRSEVDNRPSPGHGA
jgi:hypothetical protein